MKFGYRCCLLHINFHVKKNLICISIYTYLHILVWFCEFICESELFNVCEDINQRGHLYLCLESLPMRKSVRFTIGTDIVNPMYENTCRTYGRFIWIMWYRLNHMKDSVMHVNRINKFYSLFQIHMFYSCWVVNFLNTLSIFLNIFKHSRYLHNCFSHLFVCSQGDAHFHRIKLRCILSVLIISL